MPSAPAVGSPALDLALAHGISELRANVLIALEGTSHPAILITSAVTAEYRRRIGTQLASAIATTGRLVVLVDADCESRADSMAAASAPGSSHLTIARTPASEHGDAAYLVSSDLRASLEEWKRSSDLVVIVGPSLLGVAETRAVSAMCDGTLVVATHGSAQRDQAIRAANVLRESGARVVGAVIASG